MYIISPGNAVHCTLGPSANTNGLVSFFAQAIEICGAVRLFMYTSCTADVTHEVGVNKMVVVTSFLEQIIVAIAGAIVDTTRHLHHIGLLTKGFYVWIIPDTVSLIHLACKARVEHNSTCMREAILGEHVYLDAHTFAGKCVITDRS